MSVFNTDETPDSYFDQLVGEGKKFSNQEELARGKAESDRYIQELKDKLAELETDKKVEERVAELLNRQNSNPDPTPNGEEAHQPAKPSEKVDLTEEVRKILHAESKQARVANNVNEVADKLISVYGDEEKANQIVKQKAKELNVSVEYLQDVAAQSPQAFYTLIRLDDQPAHSARPTHGDVNPAALKNNPANAKPNTYRFFEQMRKENPKLWSSREIQLQIHKAALANPDAFFERQ